MSARGWSGSAGAALTTLAGYPPVLGGTSFDLSNVVQEFLRRSKQ